MTEPGKKKFPRPGPGSPTVMYRNPIISKSSPRKKFPRPDRGSPTNRDVQKSLLFPNPAPEKKLPRPDRGSPPHRNNNPRHEHGSPTSRHVTPLHVTHHHVTSRHCTSPHTDKELECFCLGMLYWDNLFACLMVWLVYRLFLSCF